MKHRLAPSQYAVLLTIVLTASFGDALLSRGMAQNVARHGALDLHHLGRLIPALANLNIVAGIILLIGFFASYMTALSWADLTFVMPATAFGNVLIALLSRFLLHEHLSLSRWIGILLLTSAVGFVADRPPRTDTQAPGTPLPDVAAPETLPVTQSGVAL